MSRRRPCAYGPAARLPAPTRHDMTRTRTHTHTRTNTLAHRRSNRLACPALRPPAPPARWRQRVGRGRGGGEWSVVGMGSRSRPRASGGGLSVCFASLFCKIRKVFDSNSFFYCRSLLNPVLYMIHMESVVGRLHCVLRVIREQSPLESPALCPHPQLWRGAPRRARRSLRGRPCPRHPPPPPPRQAAALCLPEPPSLLT